MGGYLILDVSRMYARLSSLLSATEDDGSPATAMTCLPKAVMLCPDRGDGE